MRQYLSFPTVSLHSPIRWNRRAGDSDSPNFKDKGRGKEEIQLKKKIEGGGAVLKKKKRHIHSGDLSSKITLENMALLSGGCGQAKAKCSQNPVSLPTPPGTWQDYNSQQALQINWCLCDRFRPMGHEQKLHQCIVLLFPHIGSHELRWWHHKMGQPRSGNHSKEDRYRAELDAGVLGSLASAD